MTADGVACACHVQLVSAVVPAPAAAPALLLLLLLLLMGLSAAVILRLQSPCRVESSESLLIARSVCCWCKFCGGDGTYGMLQAGIKLFYTPSCTLRQTRLFIKVAQGTLACVPGDVCAVATSEGKASSRRARCRYLKHFHLLRNYMYSVKEFEHVIATCDVQGRAGQALV
jgi:hypothetical protein